MKAAITALGLVLGLALPAGAQHLTLHIGDGRVTLDAVDVPARQILAEWARVGGTRVVGAEKITGGALTLKLTDMPERQALDIILRNVAGFMAATRADSAPAGASAYDRILIMATSTVAPSAANAGRPGVQQAGAGRRVPPRPPDLPPSMGDDPPEYPIEDDQTDTGAPPVFAFPNQPNAPNMPVFMPMQGNPPGVGTGPVITLEPGQNGPAIYNFVPANPGGEQAPQNQGFTIIGSPTPGMIQVPQPAVPPTPSPTQRPPGR